MGDIAFLVATALAGAYQPQPLFAVSTGKSLDGFGACFVQSQEQAGRPWAFSASDRGGSFTNEGASGGAAVYRLQFTTSGAANQLRLYSGRSPDSAALVRAVDQCR